MATDGFNGLDGSGSATEATAAPESMRSECTEPVGLAVGGGVDSEDMLRVNVLYDPRRNVSDKCTCAVALT